MKKYCWFALLFMACSAVAFAADGSNADTTVLDNFVDKFATASTNIETTMRSAGITLFWGLAIIGFIWQWIPLAAGGFKGDLGDMFVPLVKWISITGIFWVFFYDAPYLAELITNSFMQLAANAGGGASGVNYGAHPGQIVYLASEPMYAVIDAIKSVYEKASNAGWFDTIAALIQLICNIVPLALLFVLALIAGLFLAYVAVEVAITLIIATLFASIAMIVAAFGGANFTREWAIAYFKQVIGIGLHIMTLIIVANIGAAVCADIIHSNINYTVGDMPMLFKAVWGGFLVVIASFMLLVIAQRLPPMVAGLVGARTSGGLTSAMGAALMAGAATVATGAAGGAALAGAVKSGVMEGLASGGILGAFNGGVKGGAQLLAKAAAGGSSLGRAADNLSRRAESRAEFAANQKAMEAMPSNIVNATQGSLDQVASQIEKMNQRGALDKPSDGGGLS